MEEWRGQTSAIHFAASRGVPEICIMLLERGADINVRSEKGQTPLIAAAKRGQYHIIDFLLEKGADLDAETEYGETALHAACYAVNIDVAKKEKKRFNLYGTVHEEQRKSEETVRALKRLGLDVTKKNKKEQTPEEVAMKAKHFNLVEVLRETENRDIPEEGEYA